MEKHLKNAEKVARLLDTNFSFLGIRFGYDTVIGLIPILGDTVTFVYTLYMVWIAIQLRLPSAVISKMIANAGIDYVIGLVPGFEIGDIFFRSGVRNYKILNKAVMEMNVLEGEKVM